MRLMRLFLLSLFLLSGCSSVVVVQPVPTADPLASWKNVLQKHVDPEGRVNFEALAKDRSDLDAFVFYVSQHSPDATPEEFPDKASKLAFYLNAYHALAMYNVLSLGIPADNNSFLKRFRFFYLVKFPIGGNEISLYGLENDYIRPMGETRIHYALNAMAKSGPRLYREPFVAEHLEMQLQSLTQAFYNEKRNIEIDNEEKAVRVSELVEFFTDDLIKDSPAIIAHINHYRAETDQIPLDYDVEFQEYDWTTNRQ